MSKMRYFIRKNCDECEEAVNSSHLLKSQDEIRGSDITPWDSVNNSSWLPQYWKLIFMHINYFYENFWSPSDCAGENDSDCYFWEGSSPFGRTSACESSIILHCLVHIFVIHTLRGCLKFSCYPYFLLLFYRFLSASCWNHHAMWSIWLPISPSVSLLQFIFVVWSFVSILKYLISSRDLALIL